MVKRPSLLREACGTSNWKGKEWIVSFDSENISGLISDYRMTTIKVADDGGDTVTICEFKGYRYPNFPNIQKILSNFPSVDVRSDDIFICAFPKSGTHWLFDIVRFLVAGKVDAEDISKGMGMMEFVEEESYKENPSPRLLNTHLLFDHLPVQVKTKKPKIIYIDRNPKDMLVSYYNFIKKIPFYEYIGEWKNFLKPSVEGKLDYGSWFDYVKDWEEAKKTSDIPILPLNYEDMKEDLYTAVVKIRNFLNLDRSDEFLREVCNNCDFSKMKETKVQTSDLVFRKGEVGDWKNWFTVAQNEWFDQLYQEKMQDCPLTFRYSL